MFKKPSRKVHTVFVHHSATDNPLHDNTIFIHKVHVEQNGWSDIGYHYFIDKAGNITPCRPLSRRPAAQKGHNKGSIAICLSGRYDFTKEQQKALTELCNQINDAYDGEMVFKGHKEVAATECPNYPYKEWLNLDERGIMQPISLWQILLNFLKGK